MQIHNTTYCCSQMDTWRVNNIVAVDYVAHKAHMRVFHTPTPGDDYDPDPTVTTIEIKHCPNCGDLITVYSEAVPSPTYTRATTVGGACDDNTCRHNNTTTSVCAFAFREIGCFSTDSAVRVAYEDLLVKMHMGISDFVKE